MTTFKVGDVVVWKSQSHGFHTEKCGTVNEIVPAWQKPNKERHPSLYKGAGVGNSRNHESYIVVLFVGTSLKTYWPRVSALKAKVE